MVWESIKEAITGESRKKKRRKIEVGVAAGAAAVAGLIATARKLREKGYDEKAINVLHESSKRLKEEAKKIEKEIKKKTKKRKTPDKDLKKFRKKLERTTKKEMKKLAKKEYGIELSTNNLKKEMIDKFIRELRKR